MRDVERDPDFIAGNYHVQDYSSQLCCKAVSPRKGETVIDICAAPGGKTFTMAEMMGDEGRIFACELHEKRTGIPDLFKHLRQLLRAVEEQNEYGYIYKERFHSSISFICKIRVCCNADVYSLNLVIAYSHRISSLAQHLFGVVRGTFFLQIPFLSVEKYRLYSAV